ncbi:NepR family anti-sigma factor [Sphingomonas sp.]|uniref:NepR family anti-sigma factor n=1 Tax=Sphingomonas sp. TaxID=28214 RepID=UPI0035BC7BAA
MKTATTGKAADQRPRIADTATQPRATPQSLATKLQGKDRDMGTALRSVYQRTVDEAIPDDLLDLLGKLG